MADTLPTFTAAAVQAAPVFLDRDATVDKACGLIAEAAAAGADLIVFPETFVPGYPFWHTTDAVRSGDTYARLWKNAVEASSPAAAELAAAARRASAYVVIGIHERDTVGRGTLYNTLLYLSPEGDVVYRHRKLMPSFTERTVWGLGDGSDLAVIDTPLGRLGGLICWEHQMTLAKYALYAQGEQVHCAAWPAYTAQNAQIDFGMRQYAFEGACFVVSACGVVTPGALPESLGGGRVRANGGSGIIAPDGSYLAGPVYDREEIVYASVNLEQTLRERHARDIAGHYARPDVLRLVVTGRPRPGVTFADARADATRAIRGTTADVADRLEVVRDYLGSLIDRVGEDSDAEVDEAIAEALASIDMAAAGIWNGQ